MSCLIVVLFMTVSRLIRFYHVTQCRLRTRYSTNHLNSCTIIEIPASTRKKCLNYIEFWREQYQTVNYDTIKKYPLSEQGRITSSIFRNIDRSDLHVTPAVVNSHFRKNIKICWTWQIFQKFVGIRCMKRIYTWQISILTFFCFFQKFNRENVFNWNLCRF